MECRVLGLWFRPETVEGGSGFRVVSGPRVQEARSSIPNAKEQGLSDNRRKRNFPTLSYYYFGLRV